MKNNSEDMVTKTEFRKAVGRLDDAVNRLEETMYTKADHAKFAERLNAIFLTKAEFGDFREWLKENMYTKQEHARDMVWMDKAMTEIEAAREERLLSERQILRIDDLVFDHEKRIRVLEKK